MMAGNNYMYVVRTYILIALSLIYIRGFSQNQIVSSWNLKIDQNEIKDAYSKHQISKNVSTENGVISGVADQYWPLLDLADHEFQLEGYFMTKGNSEQTMAIVGNRSALSEYTGWDFMMLKDGTLRLLVNIGENVNKTLTTSTRTFNDDLEHHFNIYWKPEFSELTMVVDKKFKYKISLSIPLERNNKRMFFIAAQPNAKGLKTLPFKGKLRDLVLRSNVVASEVAVGGLEKLDAELGNKVARTESTYWVDSKQLTIEGMGWNQGIEAFTRLPDDFKDIVTPKVWSLSRHSAGLAVRFVVKGTKSISARWTLKANGYMAHMTSQAVNGLDLYVKIDNKWTWAGVGKPSRDGLKQESTIKSGFLPDRTYECMVYLPLYTGVTALDFGFSAGASVTAAVVNSKKPLVFYGTSILHGCSASRSGMPFAAMLGRKFDRPVVNLGFSGNGLMESYFADILTKIDAAIYFIDCLPNMGALSEVEIKDRTINIIRKLRSKRPDVPIVLVEDRNYAYANLSGKYEINHRRIGMQSAYGILKAEVKNLYYMSGDGLLGDDTEATVDGSHPSDLGMYRYFMCLSPLVSKILNGK